MTAAPLEVLSAISQLNAHDLELELAWFARLLDARFKLYFGAAGGRPGRVRDRAARSRGLRIALRRLRAALPALLRRADGARAGAWCRISGRSCSTSSIRKNKTFDRKFTEFGGVRGRRRRFRADRRDAGLHPGGHRPRHCASRCRRCSTATTSSPGTISCGSFPRPRRAAHEGARCGSRTNAWA